ncbi:MAG: cytochrome aa3 oxidase assembly protein CtaA [Candidatus Poribacteria bacterium]|nr:MAG: cytochrome aa3 oxidase assembly protein CtaA [Candidatus Poribacteria bacterium]
MEETLPRGLYRLALITSVATFVLLFVGGLVTSTGSGLSVPDWPLSYGMLFPPMVGGILYEHGHRMVAGVVALMTTVLLIWVWLREPRGWVRLFALAVWLLVLIQAVLGGLTVLLRLPVAVSVSHAGVAELFFAGTVLLALFLSPAWRRAQREPAPATALYRWTALAVTVTFGQILLGAWVRHSGAGLAIPDFPLSYGRLLPPLGANALREVNAFITGQPYIPAVTSMTQVWAHFLHRLGAGVTAIVLLGLWHHTRRNYSADRALRLLANGLILLLVAQVALGALTVWTKKSVIIATAHLAGGALIFVGTVLLAAWSRRCYLPTEEPAAAPLRGEVRA